MSFFVEDILGGKLLKRKGNLYPDIYKFENIEKVFDEVCRNTKNKNRVNRFKEYKAVYISRIHDILKRQEYEVGPYNVFTIYEPKERRIVSQNMQDKIVNHLVARYILYPAILPCLLDVNVASRKNLGTRKGVELSLEYNRRFKVKYNKYYVLKCDISKFFESIDKEILKKKVERRIKDKDALKIVFKIIVVRRRAWVFGNMTSQILAIFYLNDLDHYIKEELKIKGFIRYQDDFLLFHHSKKYLRECLEKIRTFLEKENLTLNRKTRIYTGNYIFLGRNRNGKYVRYRDVKRKIKKRMYLYKRGLVKLNGMTNTIICYKGLKAYKF